MEQLLTQRQVADALGFSVRQFQRLRPKLHGNGLLPVRIGTRAVRFRRSDLERIIREAAETENAIGV